MENQETAENENIQPEIRENHKPFGRRDPPEPTHMIRKIIDCTIFMALILAIIMGLARDVNSENTAGASSIPEVPYSRSFKKAAVVSNARECADVGKEIFRKGGSVADAAIATLLCEGVCCFQSMGIGGGFLLVIYNKDTKEINTLNAREAAPMASFEDIFEGNATMSSRGGLSVAVPGELRGYEQLYKMHGGKVPWKDLFEPTIKMCRSGILITDYTAKVLKSRENDILNTPSLRPIFINPATNKTWNSGDRMKRLKLAETLEVIAKEGADALYNGSLTDKFVEDIRNFNGIITRTDMEQYQAKWEKPIVMELHSGLRLFSSPLPGAGPVLKICFNVFKNFMPDSIDSDLTWHRVIETFKYAYGVRTEFGDPDFIEDINNLVSNVTSPRHADFIRRHITDDMTYNNPRHYGAKYTQAVDYGTAHLSFYAPNGDAISVTSTINLVLGAFIMSPQTGIVLNNQMDDFSDPYMTNAFGLPPSPSNFVRPGKRPLSSMCPSIIVDKFGDVRLVIGGAGGTKITTSVALVILRHLYFGQGIVESMVAPRIHHQLTPMQVIMESGFNENLVQDLQKRGHQITIRDPGDGFAAITAISKEGPYLLNPFSDPRRNGSVAGLD